MITCYPLLTEKQRIFFTYKYKRMTSKNWHTQHIESFSIGQRIADAVANGMGSWTFIIAQTLFVIIWMVLNVVGIIRHWDVYPFILLNLIFSTQAAYAAPIIMMAQNRQNERDRVQAQADFTTNVEAKKEIEALQIRLNEIEIQKLDKIIQMLERVSSSNPS
jgi:uncharacterized membrane protein